MSGDELLAVSNKIPGVNRIFEGLDFLANAIFRVVGPAQRFCSGV